MKETLRKHKQYLLTGVSYVVPFIACGGILIASAIAFAPMTPAGPDFSHAPKLKLVLDIGSGAFSMALPVLAGFIAYAMANKPGLVRWPPACWRGMRSILSNASRRIGWSGR